MVHPFVQVFTKKQIILVLQYQVPVTEQRYANTSPYVCLLWIEQTKQ